MSSSVTSIAMLQKRIGEMLPGPVKDGSQRARGMLTYGRDLDAEWGRDHEVESWTGENRAGASREERRIIVRPYARLLAAKKQMEKKAKKTQEKWEKKLWYLSVRSFSCEKDALGTQRKYPLSYQSM